MTVGAAVLGTSTPARPAAIEDLDKLALMLHGVQAVYASAAMAMKSYRAGLITQEEAAGEIARNRQFLAVLSKCGAQAESDAGPADYDQVSFAKNFLGVCNYLELALDSFKTFVEEGNDLDSKLFDRQLTNAENAITRMLKQISGQ